jgi:RNA polymerase sigma-70 factor (family 1)
VNKKSQETEEEYVHSLQRGEKKGFSFFFRQLYAPLCQFAFRILKEDGIYEDLVQDCFLKLWKKAPTLKDPRAIKSYLYVAIRNECLSYLRNQKKEAKFSGELKNHFPASESEIIENIVFAETTHEIYSAINNLPPKMQRVFRMFFIEGKNYEEIASELHLSVRTIRNQKLRALFLIKQRVGPTLIILLFLKND